MITLFFDTSAVVKRYHSEIGSEVIDEIFDRRGQNLAISYWTVLEFTVAMSARTRRKQLSRNALNEVVSRFLKDVLDNFVIISVNDELIATASPLAVEYALPSADCLQLACGKS